MSDILKIFIYIFCIILLSLSRKNNGQEIREPATEFSRLKLVKPLLYHARTKREIISTKHTDDMRYPEVTMTIDMDGEQHMLDLKLNKHLVSGGHIIRYQKDGHRILHKPTIQELDICQYSGTVRGRKGSWAALSTCHGVRGIIHDGKQTRYIEPAEGNNIDSNHYVYNHFDLKTNYKFESHQATNKTNYPDRMKKYQEEQSIQSVISRHKREKETKYKEPFNSGKFSRYLELAFVADNALYKAYGENIDNLHMHLRGIANIVHSLFAPWNIYVALVGVDIWSEKDQIKFEDDDILSSFLHYRKTKLGRDIPNDNAQLLIHYNSSSMVLNDAILGSMCNEQLSGGVIRADSQNLGIIATRIAHSIGHNLNMSDDSEYCYCPGASCIMCPSINENKLPTHWSSCSFLSLIEAFDKGLGYCLRNKPKRLFGSPFCGNGFIEFNEECDCGVYPSVECAVCCNPLTCLLKPNATCALGDCCDLWTCQPEEILTVCRPENNECDLPEYCNGFSGDCPKDVHKMDTTPCSNGEAYCVKGKCTTHSDRCKLLWGESGRMSNKKCYETFNVQGNENGYCGYRRGEQITYKECSQQDALCGLLHCEHDNSSLQIGMGYETTKSNQVNQSFTNPGLRNLTHFHDCNTAMIDLGPPEEDPGLVPDGAKCGEDMMCLKQKCVSIASIRQGIAKMKTSICPSNCSGNGICNSKGHCHCSPGFEPPLCDRASVGSIDSGPTYYMKSKPKPLFGSSFCGNGVIEFNEECDYGVYPSQTCAICCNPLTCLLKPNATCAVGECCDLLTCQLKKILTVCRPEKNECDLPEYCNGFSGDCPKDVHMMDTTPCSDGEAYCVKGECSTHSDRCELLWGESGRMSNKKCYETFNVQGNENGYCGYRRGEQVTYKECSQQDALCGILHCEHDNSSLQIGMGYETTKSNQVNESFANPGLRNLTHFHDCNTAMIDLGPPEEDPGLVPDGAKCGEDMMCLKQKCVSIASIRQGIVKMKTFICPSNCSGNGICNSEGHCHCSFGLAPPLCNRASIGSIDSGSIYYIKSEETTP